MFYVYFQSQMWIDTNFVAVVGIHKVLTRHNHFFKYLYLFVYVFGSWYAELVHWLEEVWGHWAPWNMFGICQFNDFGVFSGIWQNLFPHFVFYREYIMNVLYIVL